MSWWHTFFPSWFQLLGWLIYIMWREEWKFNRKCLPLLKGWALYLKELYLMLAREGFFYWLNHFCYVFFFSFILPWVYEYLTKKLIIPLPHSSSNTRLVCNKTKLYICNNIYFYQCVAIFTRPGVAGAVLRSPSSF